MKRINPRWVTGTQIVIVIGFCLFVVAASWETPLVVELTKHFGIKDSDMGRLMGLQNGLMTLFGLVGGYLSGRYRRTWLWGLGFLMAAACSLIIWIGLRQGMSFELFFLLKLITGICLGITWPLPFIMLMDAVPMERRNLMFGILFLMGGVGNALGTFLPSICLSLNWGLEGGYFSLAFLMLVSAVLMALSKDPKRGAQDASLKDVLAQGCVEYDFHMRPADIKAVASKPINLLIASYSALNLIPMQFISLWMITYLVRSYGMAEVMASLVMMICFVGLVTGNVLGGYVADRPGLRSPEGRIKLAMICAIVAMPFLMVSFISKWPLVVLAALMFAGWTFYGSASPAIGSLGQEVNLPEHRGVWTSVNNIIGGAANMACLWVPPILAEMFGGDYARPFMLSSLVFVPVVFILLVIRRRIKRDVGHVNNTLAERAEQMRLKLAQELSGQTSLAAGKESVAKRER